MSQLVRFSKELPARPIAPAPAAQPPPEPKPEPEPPQAEPAAALQPAALYRELVATGGAIFSAAAEEKTPDLKKATAQLRQICDLLGQGDTGLLAETVRHRSKTYSWAERGANTAILAMRLGLELRLDERQIIGGGLCALMHDLGMLTIPPALLSTRQLSTEQLELLRRHPLESQRLVTRFGGNLAWVEKIVLQIHERHDGSGYPRGLKGNQIHQLAGAIGLADTYQAMAHPRADRKAMVIYNALKEIIDLRNQLFDHQLVKALIHIVSIFPLGSLVQLNNGTIGRVVATSKLHPTRPTIEVLIDQHHHRLQQTQMMNLAAEPMLYITDPAIEEDILER